MQSHIQIKFYSIHVINNGRWTHIRWEFWMQQTQTVVTITAAVCIMVDRIEYTRNFCCTMCDVRCALCNRYDWKFNCSRGFERPSNILEHSEHLFKLQFRSVAHRISHSLANCWWLYAVNRYVVDCPRATNTSKVPNFVFSWKDTDETKIFDSRMLCWKWFVFGIRSSWIRTTNEKYCMSDRPH